jgi:hypothetical protein
MLSRSVWRGWIVLPTSTVSAPISIDSPISPIMSLECVPTMPAPELDHYAQVKIDTK